MSKSPEKFLTIFIGLTLILMSLIVFWQMRNFDFVNYDDIEYVSGNEHVLRGLNFNNLLWAFTTGHSANWHPLTWLSLMLDCSLFGPNPGPMHLENLFFHLANTLLLFAILKKITLSIWPSAFVAALFVIHPMHVESVAWIAERKDVLSTLFFLLTLIVYVRYTRHGGMLNYMLSILLFALGLLAKPMLITLPFLLLLLDYWPLNRFGKLSSLVIEKIPFFILSAISGIVTLLVQQHSGAVIQIGTLSFSDRIANALVSYIRYIGKMFWPRNLAVFYPPDVGKIALFEIVLCAVLLIMISALVIYFGRSKRYLPVGWFWFIGTLIPVIGLIQVGDQAMADRYTYISYIGLFVIIAWGAPALVSKWYYQKIFFTISIPVLLTILGFFAHRQAGYWKNGLTLFSHALEVTQNNYVAYNNLGVAYEKAGNHQEAIKAYEYAIQIKPTYADVYCNLGLTYLKLGRYQEVIQSFRQALNINPKNPKAYEILGNSYYNIGQYDSAIEIYKQALQIYPDYAEAYNDLGAVYGKLGRYQEAINALEQAIQLKPDYFEAYFNSAMIYSALGLAQKEIDAYEHAIQIHPEDARTYDILGNVYSKIGRYDDAIEIYRQAIRIKPDYAEAYNDLGTVYGKLGRFHDAIAAFTHALNIKPDFPLARKNLELANRKLGR